MNSKACAIAVCLHTFCSTAASMDNAGNARFLNYALQPTGFDLHSEAALLGIAQLAPQPVLHHASSLDQYLKEYLASPGVADAFHVIDIHPLIQRYHDWKLHLPAIQPYYAVKVNPDPVIVTSLMGMGTGFDCASISEIKQILSYGATPDRILFAHTRKPTQDIRAAYQLGVTKMTFDSIEELEKMATVAPESQYILRIKVDDLHSATPLGSKFGATLEEAKSILAYAKKHRLDIAGVSFHVGSNCHDENTFIAAIQDAATILRLGKSHYGFSMQWLDLGGGWPGDDAAGFLRIAEAVNQQIAKIPDHASLHLVAEPGRYFATPTMTIGMRIIGKRLIKNTADQMTAEYYLSNGAYGFFMSSLYYQYDARSLKEEGWKFEPFQRNPAAPQLLTRLWGPTCDSGDKIIDDLLLPEMKTGDFLLAKDVGAYTNALATQFNQITPSHVHYVMSTAQLEKS